MIIARFVGGPYHDLIRQLDEVVLPFRLSRLEGPGSYYLVGLEGTQEYVYQWQGSDHWVLEESQRSEHLRGHALDVGSDRETAQATFTHASRSIREHFHDGMPSFASLIELLRTWQEQYLDGWEARTAARLAQSEIQIRPEWIQTVTFQDADDAVGIPTEEVVEIRNRDGSFDQVIFREEPVQEPDISVDGGSGMLLEELLGEREWQDNYAGACDDCEGVELRESRRSEERFEQMAADRRREVRAQREHDAQALNALNRTDPW